MTENGERIPFVVLLGVDKIRELSADKLPIRYRRDTKVQELLEVLRQEPADSFLAMSITVRGKKGKVIEVASLVQRSDTRFQLTEAGRKATEDALSL